MNFNNNLLFMQFLHKFRYYLVWSVLSILIVSRLGPAFCTVVILGLFTEGAWVPSEVIKIEVLSFQYYICSTELS